MTDIDDFGGHYDDADMARAEELPDGFYEQQPVDLEEVEQRLERLEPLLPPPGLVREDDKQWLVDLREMICHDVPGLVADLRAARQRIADWEALEKRIEVVSASGDDPDKAGLVIAFQSLVKASEHADKTPGFNVFTRIHTLQLWQRLDKNAPF